MPPKRAADDAEDVASQEALDAQFWKAAQGGDLTTIEGEVEGKLPQARKVERVRERTRLLGEVLRPELVRRLCRRAGVSMYATTAPDDSDTVVNVLRQLADIFLFNLSFEITRLCTHTRKQTISEDLLLEALASFGEKIAGACGERHETCRTMKQHRNKTGAETMRGAAMEIHHERKHNEGPCVYFAHAPFVRLLRVYLTEQKTLDHPLKPTAGVVSCIQLTLEQKLIDILEKARYVVRHVTKKKDDSSPPGRTTLFARDIKTVLVVLSHKHPILRGRMRALDEARRPRQTSPRRGGGARGAEASPKAKAKAKAKAPPRAKAAARAKSGR